MKPVLSPSSSSFSGSGVRLKQRWKTASLEQRLRVGHDFFYAEIALRLLTFLWLHWALAKFEVLLLRPSVLYSPATLFGQWLAPALPATEIFWAVVAVAAVMNGMKLFWRNKIWPQAVLALCLLWINLVLWSYGYLPNVNHLFLLAHLFLLFACFEKNSLYSGQKEVYAGINWFYFGLLFTYSLAGVWKVAALAYKLVTQSADVHWLRPEAALYNALVNFRDYDLPVTFAQLFTHYAWVWQLGFLAVVYLQVVAVWAAWRPALRPAMGALLVSFHLLNQFAFLVSFTVAILTLLCLFFPYSLVFRRVSKLEPCQISFTGQRRQARYRREYANGLLELYQGFEAYRQRLLDKNYYLFGMLYLPGIQSLVRLWWWVQEKLLKSSASHS